MARARNIKPGFFQNDELGELEPLSRLLFIGMWTIADYKGCIEYRPKRIKAQLLPYDNCNISALVINLDKSGFISIYSVLGQRYIKVINFEKHQNPHKNEKESGSDIPDITEKDCEIRELTQDGSTPDKNGTTPADSLILIPDTGYLNPVAAKPEKAKPAALATRLPADWMPSYDDARFCASERKDLNIDTTASRFRDYWIAQPGVKGRKLDWSATWRNWVRNEKQQARTSPASYESAKDRSRREASEQLTGRKQHEQRHQFTDIN